ncbi:hypothetical protein LUZ60_009865 [Juncus effusus]|nr:hypothetical protein LUZ60_009865 [Juncus effusus]
MHCLSIFLLCLLATKTIGAYNCLQNERDALLEFKAGVHDPSGRLASWRGDECCTWAGVKCSNQTSHVVKLNLQPADYDNNLSGEISPSLEALTDLKHLDLSFNNFSGSTFPKFICSFRNLKYLDLSEIELSGTIPQQLGNLSKLQHLHLTNNYAPLSISNIQCLSHLTSLKYLSMFGVNLHNSSEWVQTLNMLPSLETLILGENNLTTIPSSLSTVNFTSLTSFSLEGNHFNTLMPDWIGQLTSLKELELFDCSFIGSIPDIFGNLSSLNSLYLDRNYDLKGPVPSFRNLHSLTSLWLEDININEDITTLLSNLSNNTLEKLEYLGLRNTSLTGNLTGWLDKVPNLNRLILSMSKLNGAIPIEISNLSNLTGLDLSGNSFTGEISDVHLNGLPKLEYLSFSSINITIDSNWVPPFQLTVLGLGTCKLGPTFPSWLHNQFELRILNLSNSRIHDSMPDWFWNLSSLSYIDLSHNQISGMLPLNLEHFTELDTIILSNNQFYGEIPALPSSLTTLDLSKNSFSGPLPQKFKVPPYLIYHNFVK